MERLPARKHGQFSRVPLSSETTWELRRSSGERCAAPSCDWRGASGEARLIPGTAPAGDTLCRPVPHCARLKRHWKCGLDRIHILSTGSAAVEGGP
ncbi:hypothetical protein NDU88_003547 [Pleurodeles waltl]|uniref:Uncharacterized protein n=1 Tax=Pleurodeles waltl TaxID=8319 RepID=A0AAV7LIU1_PLEWA|nr:hypothetical protein NDU88_003547 [Pleurodeles waltl]